MVKTISGSEIEGRHIPACCGVEVVDKTRRVVCKDNACSIKVCFFRDEYEEKKQKGTTIYD